MHLRRISEAEVLPVGGPLTAATSKREIVAALSTRRHSYVILPGLPSSAPPIAGPQPKRVIRVSDGRGGILLWHTPNGWTLRSDGKTRLPGSWQELGDMLPRPSRGYAGDCTRRLRQHIGVRP